MQWNSLLKTKLVLAGLLVALVAGDSLARPGDRLFGRRSNSNYYDTPVQQYQVVPVTQTTQQPAQAMPVAAAPATPVQPAQPTQAQPVVQQPQMQTEPQYTTQRRGLFGRRTQVAQTPVQQGQPTTPGTTTTPTTGNNNNRQSFYPAPGNQQSLIEVRLPVATAEVLFNGTATTQTGVNRMFITPALDAQGENRYEVTIRYTENGNPVEQKREIKATPGGRLVIDFTQPQQAQQPQLPLQAQPQQPQQPQPEQP